MVCQSVQMILGKEADKHETRYQHLAQTLGCAHRVHFLGYRKDVGKLYATADLFVLPSLFDPIANVVLESLYSGTPVITGSQVGASELIDHGNNGFIIPEESSKIHRISHKLAEEKGKDLEEIIGLISSPLFDLS